MSRGTPVKTPNRVAEARRLRDEEGLLLREIGERFGVSGKAICEWLRDPDGSRQAKRRARSAEACAGACGVCGVPTTGSRGRVNAPTLCPTHALEEQTIWTPGAILLAIQEWAAKYGEAPAASDWNVTQLRDTLRDHERAARYEREHAAGVCCDIRTVFRAFGTWNAAIAAAGFEPRPAHGGGVNVARRRSARAKAAA